MPHDDGRVLMTVSGRRLDVLTDGPADGPALVFHSGTPSAAVPFRPLTEAAAARGLRLVTWSRPGYGGSDAAPGRSVADVSSDTAAVLDALAIDEFVTLGWSGGGPHALACAALLPRRCRAAATIAGVAPCTAEGLDWMAGMGAENVEEFSLAILGEESLTPYLNAHAEVLRRVTGADVAESLGGLCSSVDRASLTGEFAEYVAAQFRRAVARGVAGWRDDDLAFTRDWASGSRTSIARSRSGRATRTSWSPLPTGGGSPTGCRMSAHTCMPTRGTCRWRSARSTASSPI
jgi:pimeloyl-ACP methyl ester carboxylesterase